MVNNRKSLPPIVFSTCRKYQDVAEITLKKLLDLLSKENLEIEIFIFSDSDEIIKCLKLEGNPKIKIYTIDSESWNKVVLNGINSLIQSNYEYCLLMTDDFYWKSCDFLKLINLYKILYENDFDYLKLVVTDPINRLFSLRLKSPRFDKNFSNCYLINPDHPYPCSLRPSFWKLNYLAEKLKNQGNIWDFERQAASVYSYVVDSNVLDIPDLLEKGKKRLICFFIKDAHSLDRPYKSLKDILIDLKRSIRNNVFSFIGMQKKAKRVYLLDGDLEESIIFNPLNSKKNLYKFLYLRYKYNIYNIVDLSEYAKSPIKYLVRLISIPLLSLLNGISIRRFICIFNKSKFRKLINSSQTIIIFFRKTNSQLNFIKNLDACNIVLIIDNQNFNYEDEEYIQNILINNKNKKIEIISLHNLKTNKLKINNQFFREKYLDRKWFLKV